MKKILKITVMTLLIFTLSIILNLNISNAASAGITASSTSVTTGTSVTVTGTVTAGGWNLTLSGASQSKGLVGFTGTTDNQLASTSITFTPTSEGTYTFNLTGDMTDYYTDVTESVNKSITITATAPAPITPTEPTTPAPQPSTPVEQPKSSNANLASLGITPAEYDFSGFKASNTTYYVTIPYEVTKISVVARAQDSKAKVSGTGSRNINVGQTTLNVTVTAENGATKKYSIVVTRKTEAESVKPEEKPEETKSNNSNLQTLTIEEGTLQPEFSADIKEYTLTVPAEILSLTINPIVEDSKATFAVEGNENLQEGENIVNITVTAEDGTTSIYKITVIRGETILELKSLKIGYMDENNIFITLTTLPEFISSIHEYTINGLEYYIDSLEIEAFPNFEDAEIEMIGNENLQEGQNIIRIIIKRIKNKQETEETLEEQQVEEVEYIITVNKEEKPEEPAVGFIQKILKWFKGIPGTVSNWTNNNQRQILVGALGVCSIALFGLSIYMIIDYRRYKMLLKKLAELVKINASEQVQETNQKTNNDSNKEE